MKNAENLDAKELLEVPLNASIISIKKLLNSIITTMKTKK